MLAAHHLHKVHHGQIELQKEGVSAERQREGSRRTMRGRWRGAGGRAWAWSRGWSGGWSRYVTKSILMVHEIVMHAHTYIKYRDINSTDRPAKKHLNPHANK